MNEATRLRWLLTACLCVGGAGAAQGASPAADGSVPTSTNRRVLQPIAAKLEPDRKVVYKRVGERALRLHVFEPDDAGTKARPVFMIIHGGGWTGGEPRKFYPVAEHFARRGMLGISLEYRLVKPKSGVTVFDCVRDGRSAVRFVRAHAAELGVDPKRIVVAGGSAGGHVAVGTALLDFDEPGEDRSVPCAPDALVLLNPVIDTSAAGYGQAKIGERWRELSPLHQVRGGLPSTILFHSTADRVTPYAGARRFVELSRAAGNDCELVTYEGGRHGYFLFDEAAYRDLIRRIEAFLQRHGFIQGAPEK